MVMPPPYNPLDQEEASFVSQIWFVISFVVGCVVYMPFHYAYKVLILMRDLINPDIKKQEQEETERKMAEIRRFVTHYKFSA